MMMSFATITLGLLAAMAPPSGAVVDASAEHISVFEAVRLKFDPDLPEAAPREGYTLRSDGQVAERVVDLPPLPANQRDARQIVATVEVTPTLVETPGGYRPGDPWPRLGSVFVMTPDDGDMREVELMRFVTGFGGSATFTQDITAMAPLLHGRTTMRVLVDTYKDPAWEVSLTLSYCEKGVGFRRPAMAMPVFHELSHSAEDEMMRATVMIPEGVDRPRLRIISTGHATDGRGGDEFVPRTHILRVDGEEVARWKPWSEQGGSLRKLNPASGRLVIDGRELWSSDLDRSGWHPGLAVEPLLLPVPELTPGEHEVELEIQDIRPKDPADEDEEHGYWRVSVIAVADEPWPRYGGNPQTEGQDEQP